MKSIIIYFSASGNTRNVANRIKEKTGSDVFEILAAHPYSDEDLDWTDPNSRINIEVKDSSYRAPIANKLDNLDDYELIYLGFPVWWYTFPSIVKNFIETYNLEKRNIKVFCTSGSTTGDEVYNHIKNDYPFIKSVKRFTSGTSDEDMDKWINS